MVVFLVLALFCKAEKEISRYKIVFIKSKLKIFSAFLLPTLLFSGVFIPREANADFLSAIFGSSTVASAAGTQSSGVNSQNMSLLQANVSATSILGEKKTKNDKDKKIDETKEVNILADNSLLAMTGPLGVSDGTDGDISSDQISVYVVRKDDSIAKIAEMFGVSVKTIQWANDIKAGEKLKEGDVLIILPVSGVLHTVLKGQTLKGIADKYKVDISDIASFNGIAEDAPLAVGDELVVPEGIIFDDGGTKNPKNSSVITNNKKYYGKLPVITGYYMNPVPGARLSQGFHNGNGSIDLAIAKGTPILASASGKVVFAKMGWNGAYGGLVMIEHKNGTRTLYAHLSQLGTQIGEQVAQGEVIGYVGSTGRSTGPHVHFEIKGAQSPAAFYPTGVYLDANWKY